MQRVYVFVRRLVTGLGFRFAVVVYGSLPVYRSIFKALSRLAGSVDSVLMLA